MSLDLKFLLSTSTIARESLIPHRGSVSFFGSSTIFLLDDLIVFEFGNLIPIIVEKIHKYFFCMLAKLRGRKSCHSGLGGCVTIKSQMNVAVCFLGITVHPEPVEGRAIILCRSWFDRLTTNGLGLAHCCVSVVRSQLANLPQFPTMTQLTVHPGGCPPMLCVNPSVGLAICRSPAFPCNCLYISYIIRRPLAPTG